MKSPFNYTTKHFLLHSAVLLLLCGVVVFNKLDIGWGASVNITATVNLAPPENTVVTNTSPGNVDIEWNDSPAVMHVDHYEVYTKLKTDADFPDPDTTTAVLTVTDLSGIPYVISGISTAEGTDFIVYAVTATGFRSPSDCASCKTSNYFCGDDIIDPGEDCDGADLGGKLCTDFGYTSGTLSCNLTCDDLVYTSCTSGGGGGGGGTLVDTTIPNPGTATIPPYANSKPVTITYTGASDSGGNLSLVELWYKKGSGSWINSGLTSTGPSGSFSFNSFTTNDTYYFDLVAYDTAGNQSSAPLGNGDGSTKYDTTIPVSGTATSPSTSAISPINVDYTGASDAGGSGLKAVELWYKKGATGTWTNSGLTKTTASGTFAFTGVNDDATYYFDLVAEDNAGNRSAVVTGSGDTNTVYNIQRPTVILSGLPANPTYLATTNITVGGTGVTAYKYKLDSGTYGAETNVTTKIALSALTAGTHTISVIGKNAIGNWQQETNATQYSWTVDFTVPTLTISNPSVSLSTGANVTYTVTYTNANTITLSASNITLNKTGTANGSFAVTTASASVRTVTISNITGIGTLNISIAANTAQRTNGTSTAAAGPSNPFNVNVYVPACGNGVLDTGEACDDGNVINGDGCSSLCVIESLCGNGVLNTGEACDDGNVISGDGCSSTCALEILCGNGVLNSGEECDDGNVISGDGCSSICVIEIDHCNNGIQDADEEDIDCGGEDCMACHFAAPEHCTNEIKDEDEEGVDCGGLECNQCIDVDFLALAKPEGRIASVGFGVTTNIELNRRNINKITNVQPVLFNSLGIADFEITNILPGNYDAGIKGMGYLKSVIYNIPLLTEEYVVDLDFTFNGEYELIGGDVWPDNIINAGDVAQIIKIYGSPNVSVDMNRDGLVNAADMALVLRNYFKVGDNYF